jgi:iron complex outermembrane receptor protein
VFDGQLAASRYDYARDEVRAWAPVAATAATAANPAGGRITDQAGTGWHSLAAKGTWRPGGASGGASGGDAGRHIIEFGLQRDAHQLRNQVSTTADWLAGAPAAGNPASRFEGNTSLTSLWAQDAWAFATDWKAVLGLRLEQWQAERGLTTSGAGAFAHPTRREAAASPKLAVGWQPRDDWSLKLSSGRALRFPTVSALFQGGVNASTGALSNGARTSGPRTRGPPSSAASGPGSRAPRCAPRCSPRPRVTRCTARPTPRSRPTSPTSRTSSASAPRAWSWRRRPATWACAGST